MNEIHIKVNFSKGTLHSKPIKLIANDYNSTKLVFDFDINDGSKIFEMKDPNGNLVLVKEIEDNEIILTNEDENGKKASLFNIAGYYIYEISLYSNDSKLTSCSGNLKVKEEQVLIDDELVTPYLPVFDELMQDINDSINQTNNLDINVEKENNVTNIELIKKDGTRKNVEVLDGATGATGPAGYTPIKGVDYWTTSDKEEIEDEVTEQVLIDISDILDNKADKSQIPTSLNQLSNNETKYVNETQLSNAIDSLGAVFNLKGSVNTYSQLPNTNNKIGDVYYVKSESSGYVWINDEGTERWEELGFTVDTTNFLTQDGLLQTTGNSTINTMSQDAITKAIPTNLNQLANSDTKYISETQLENTNTIDIENTNNKIKANLNNNLLNKINTSITNTDYATNTTGGVIKASTTYGLTVNNTGYLTGVERNKTQYDNAVDTLLISKATLNNIIEEKDLLITYTDNTTETLKVVCFK